MATSTIKADSALYQATLNTGYSGNVWYVKFGRIVIVTLVVSSTKAITAGETIASGMPRPYGGYTIGNYPAFGADLSLRITDTGLLASDSALSAGSRTFRTSFAYISQ